MNGQLVSCDALYLGMHNRDACADALQAWARHALCTAPRQMRHNPNEWRQVKIADAAVQPSLLQLIVSSMPFDLDAPEVQKQQSAYPDLNPFLKDLDAACARGKMCRKAELFVARAPGRLDVMGGISDYSGGLVLQWPIREACYAAVQCPEGCHDICITSLRPDRQETTWQCRTADLDICQTTVSACAMFKDQKWAGYIAGCLIILRKEGYLKGGIPGCRVFLASDVPEGKGVSSSACVEVASMKAFVAALQLTIDDSTLVQLCQNVENEVVGASCGIMDQMTAMMGQKGKLMKLLCQPCTLLGHIGIPDDLAIVGIDSGERHSISGSDYSTIRAATFMSLKILKTELQRDFQYLVDISGPELNTIQSSVPDSLSGQAFLERYGQHLDAATEIDLKTLYNIRLASQHPIEEIQRVRCFSELLEQPEANAGIALGALMHASHQAYQKLELTSHWTDALYHLTREAADQGIYGGKISGGGSGGTVCILVSKEHEMAAVENIVQAFNQQRKSEIQPCIFRGSSNGAQLFGILRIQQTS